MKDSNFLQENNARHLWHPMAHPGTSIENPPNIISKAQGSTITDYDGNTVVDGVGGLWCVNVGYSCEPIKKAIIQQMDQLHITLHLAALLMNRRSNSAMNYAKCLVRRIWEGLFLLQEVLTL